MCFSGDILCGGKRYQSATAVDGKRKFLLLLLPLLADYKLKTKPNVARLWPQRPRDFWSPSTQKNLRVTLQIIAAVSLRRSWDLTREDISCIADVFQSFLMMWIQQPRRKGVPEVRSPPAMETGRGRVVVWTSETYQMCNLQNGSNEAQIYDVFSLFRMSGLLASMSTWMNIEMNKTVHVPVLEFCACIYLAVYYI